MRKPSVKSAGQIEFIKRSFWPDQSGNKLNK